MRNDSTFSLYEALTTCFNLAKSFLIDDDASLQADFKDFQDVLGSLKTFFKVFWYLILGRHVVCHKLPYPVVIFMT